MNHCQYPILEAMILKVKERCGEWVENQWVVLLPAGGEEQLEFPSSSCEQGIGGGCSAGGTFIYVMDFRRVNKLTKEPMFIIPLLKEMLGRLVGLKKIFRIRFGECLSSSHPTIVQPLLATVVNSLTESFWNRIRSLEDWSSPLFQLHHKLTIPEFAAQVLWEPCIVLQCFPHPFPDPLPHFIQKWFF